MLQYYEEKLAYMEREEDQDKTLFVQLTAFELAMVHFALQWLMVLYGDMNGIEELRNKLNELVAGQEFCDCPRCRASRGEEVDEDVS